MVVEEFRVVFSLLLLLALALENRLIGDDNDEADEFRRIAEVGESIAPSRAAGDEVAFPTLKPGVARDVLRRATFIVDALGDDGGRGVLLLLLLLLFNDDGIVIGFGREAKRLINTPLIFAVALLLNR